MKKYTYETHIIKDPVLPFIFHRRFSITKRAHSPNWHANLEILCCIDGEGYIQCGLDKAGISRGDVFVVNPDTPHSVGSDTSIEYRCLIIDEHFCAENGIPIRQLMFQSVIEDPAIYQLFESVTDAFDAQKSAGVCAVVDIRYAVLGLLRALCHQYAAISQKDLRSDEYVKKAIDYIRQNLAGNISLDQISAYVGISKFHLARQFKAYTGSTVISTVNFIRCFEAKRLIEGGMQVSAAATACGFENLSYFTRTFKKHFHALPSDFLPK